MVNMIEVFKQMVAALEDTSASKHISRNAAIQAGLKAIKELESQEPVAWRKREVGGDWQYFGWQETGMTHQAVERGNKNGFECEAIPATTTQRTEQEPVQDDHQSFIDSLPTDNDDKMFMQIDHWAHKSYKRHQSSVRGQAITAADAYKSHIVWAALRWAKENTPPQRTEQETHWRDKAYAHLREVVNLMPPEQVTSVQDFLNGVYTHPPKHTWQGLTDEEFAKCWHSNPDKAMKNVDTKLKEKNNV